MTTQKPSVQTADLRRSFGGEIIMPEDAAYDAARTIWNAMIDKRPAVIVRPKSPGDAAAAVGFGRRTGLEIGVRCGGHSVVGLSVPDGGLMIDLTAMNRVTVEPDRRRAHVQGGALLGDLDRAAQAHGLATTAGNVSHTGVGGLTLGGGMGWLARQFGLACDNLVSAEVVTADGDIVRTSATEVPDLFWAIRGGGGNFGVVTDFEFRLHPIDGRVLVVDLYYHPDDGPAVFRAWRELAPVAPRQATYTSWLGTAPDEPSTPSEMRGRLFANAGFVWIGDPEAGRPLIEPLRAVARPVVEMVDEMSYLDLQYSPPTAGSRHGLRRYWKSHYFRELSDPAIDALFTRGGDLDGGIPANAGFQTYGGAIADVGDDETAFSQRDALFELDTVVRWEDPAEDEARMLGARRLAAVMEPYASGVYVNALADEGESGVRSAYGEERLQRLVTLKDRYDPENVFHLNHNVRPSGM
jgi:FAD/FMN-containing dehydrogenase